MSIFFYDLSNKHQSDQKKKKTLYLHRRGFTLIRCSAAVSLPFFMLTITDAPAPHVSHVPLWLCLTALCAYYIESSFGTWGRNRVKCSQCSQKCSLGRLLTKIWHTAYVQRLCCLDASCTPQTEITVAIDHGILYDATFEVCKSKWFHYFQKRLCNWRLQCQCYFNKNTTRQEYW